METKKKIKQKLLKLKISNMSSKNKNYKLYIV